MIAVKKLEYQESSDSKILKWQGEIDLGTVTTEKEAFRRLYRDYGTGLTYVYILEAGGIETYFHGYIEDKDPFLIIQIKKCNYLAEKLDLEPLEWSERGYVKIKKEDAQEAEML